MRAFVLAFAFLFTTSPLYCSWDLEFKGPNPQLDSDFVALKLKVKQHLQHSWCSEEKVELLMDLTYILQPQICVEIGAFTGSSVLPVAATLDYVGQGTIYAIDAWSNEVAIQHLAPEDPNRNWWSTVDMGVIRHSFDHLMGSWGLLAVCHPIAQSSEEALPLIPEIDFLHLDGDFSEVGALYDAEHYVAKVKSGGYVLLSNVYHMVKNKQPKLKALNYLFETCEYITDVDRDNTVLFRKL